MRLRLVSKLLYWSVGFITGCLAVFLLYENCHSVDGSVVESTTFQSNSQTRRFQTIENGTKSKHVNESSVAKKDERTTTIGRSVQQVSEWLSCDRVKQIFAKAKMKISRMHRDENEDGNKGVYFTNIQNQIGQEIPVVVKYASIKNASSESHMYRYRSAIREIQNLRKLQSLNFTGTSRLLGACVFPQDITYIVTEISGIPLCEGNGTDMVCALSRKLRSSFLQSKDPSYKAILWLYKVMFAITSAYYSEVEARVCNFCRPEKVTCFFKQFEQHQMFLEDVSGINFYYSKKTLDLFLVDPDSIIFYKDVPMNSRSSCRVNNDCSRPKGNQWRFHALNHKIYYSCQESAGYCHENFCRGYDASFHTCGIGRWLLLPMENMTPHFFRNDYKRITQCMMQQYPQDRCSMADSCLEATKMFKQLSATKLSGKELLT